MQFLYALDVKIILLNTVARWETGGAVISQSSYCKLF